MKNLSIISSVFLCIMWTKELFAQSNCATIVKNIGFEKRPGNIQYVTKINNNTALFYAEDQYYGHELWRTDGSEKGTILVKDIAVGTKSSRVDYPFGSDYTLGRYNQPVALNGIMYFEANDGINGFEVWRSDGTTNGTFMLKDINLTTKWNNDQQRRQFKIFNEEVYFWDESKEWIDENYSGKLLRLYRSKGSSETTVLVGEFRGKGNSSSPLLYIYKNTLSFTIDIPNLDSPLTAKSIFYQVDKSRAISQTELHPKGTYGLCTINDQLYFSNSEGLFKSEGTANTTVLVREKGSVFTGANQEGDFWGARGLVYFISGGSLWRTDGTMTGTFIIRKGIWFDGFDLRKELIFVYKDQLYFVDNGTENSNSHGVRLWKTDGTVSGTVPVWDIDPENKAYQKYIRLVTEIDGYLYFYGEIRGVTTDIDINSGIYKSDGTAGGTKLLCSLGTNLSCILINPSLRDYGFIAIEKSLLFYGFPSGFVANYGDAELYRSELTNCPSITPTIAGSTAFCPGGSVSVVATATGGTAPYTYQWQQGATSVGTGSASLLINTAGTYTVTATDGNGCSGSAQVSATQRAAPTVSLPTTSSFCSGQSVVLTATGSSGTSPYTYAWKLGTSTVGTSAGTLSVNTGGTYGVTATDANGCVSTPAAATVTQRPSPTATITASASGFTSGNSVTLTANSGTGLTYQWTRDGQPIAGATGVAYTATQPGTYAVVVAQDGCSATATGVGISLITAIDEPLSGPDFTLSASPNPSSGAVEVRMVTALGRTVPVVLTITDLLGRTQFQKQLTVLGRYTEWLDLPALAATYLLRVTSSNQQSALRVVRH